MKTRYLSGSGREREGSLKGHTLAGEEFMGLGLGKAPGPPTGAADSPVNRHKALASSLIKCKTEH